jgi:hypothetical protein
MKEDVFIWCSSLSSINIPASIQSVLGEYATRLRVIAP